MESPVISELVRSLLARRGIVDPADVSAFLLPDYETHTHSPELLADMGRAVARLLDAVERGERIAVYADFDCDGIPGAAVLSDFFAKISYHNVEVYLPHRDREGYGFHIAAIDILASHGVQLIITVDVGTVAIDACVYARSIGIDVIVTDHHEILSALPQAVAVLNPKRGEYPFPHLCGTATAFKLVQGTLAEGKRRGLENFTAIPDGWEKWLLDLVAIATIADMVPLVGENRVLAYWGLAVLRKSPRPGINALCTRLRLRKSELSEDDIGFSIAPRINAASRMDEPDLALRLLTTRDNAEAEQLAAQLESLNASRKGVVAGIVKNARTHIRARFRDDEKIIVLGNTEWKPALLGLAANSIMNDRGGVVCLWGRDGNGQLKGSCRSDGTINLADLFVRARDAFLECGGHAASGGFSVSHEQVHTLQDVLVAAASALGAHAALSESEMLDTPTHDALIALGEISTVLLRDVLLLAPFGMGNPKPVFRIHSVTITAVRVFGKENNHIELQINDSGTKTMRAFQFFKTPEDFTHAPRAGDVVHLIATLERDTFRGPDALALRLIDVFSA